MYAVSELIKKCINSEQKKISLNFLFEVQCNATGEEKKIQKPFAVFQFIKKYRKKILFLQEMTSMLKNK